MTFVFKKIIPVIIILALYLACYGLGWLQAKNKIIQKNVEKITKKVELIRDVQKKANQIYSAPHIGREHALELFKRGIL